MAPRGLAAFALLRDSRKTDRDPLCLIASFWFVWRRGLAAFALLTNYQTYSAAGDFEVRISSLGRNQLDTDYDVLAPHEKTL